MDVMKSHEDSQQPPSMNAPDRPESDPHMVPADNPAPTNSVCLRCTRTCRGELCYRHNIQSNVNKKIHEASPEYQAMRRARYRQKVTQRRISQQKQRGCEIA